jgi:hypothetical protein
MRTEQILITWVMRRHANATRLDVWRKHGRLMAVCEYSCPKEMVEYHAPIFVLEQDVDVEKMDVSFACSYLWTPRRAILPPFVNQPRFILWRPSSTFLTISARKRHIQ